MAEEKVAGGQMTARPKPLAINGAEGDRTPDLRIANAALSQLSYSPKPRGKGTRASF